METYDPQRFDYEEWALLARENPTEFEEMRQREIERMILATPSSIQKRLRGLQWRIDMERRKCPNALAACLRLYAMMWDAVTDDNGFVYALNALADIGEFDKWRPLEVNSAIILHFPAH